MVVWFWCMEREVMVVWFWCMEREVFDRYRVQVRREETRRLRLRCIRMHRENDEDDGMKRTIDV
jgi:hypothetical protein